MDNEELECTEKSPGSHQDGPTVAHGAGQAPTEPSAQPPSNPEDLAPTAPLAEPHQPSATSADLPVGLQAHLTGEPDTLPVTWCPNCKADVLPKGKGYCPRCGRMLKGSFSARKHPVNKLRRDVLLKKLVDDYRPATTLLCATCEMLAGVLEQLEVLKPGSTEHQRLVQLSQTLGGTLEASAASSASASGSNSFSGISVMPTSKLELTQNLLQRLEAGETLSDRELGHLDMLESAMRGEVTLPPDSTDVPVFDMPVNTRIEGDGLIFLEPGDAGYVEAKTPPTAGACRYCSEPLDACAAMRTTRPDIWQALHLNHPEEVERRQKEATQTMLATMRHGSGITTW